MPSLRALRQEADYSQAAAGKLLDPPITQPYVHKHEAGTLPLSREYAIQYAILYGCEVQDIDEYPPTPKRRRSTRWGAATHQIR